MNSATLEFVESVRDPVTKLNLLIGFGDLPRAAEHFWGMVRGGFVSLWANDAELHHGLLDNPASGGLEDVVLVIEPREAASSLPQIRPDPWRNKAVTGPLQFRNFQEGQRRVIDMKQLPRMAFPLHEILRKLGWQDREKQELVRHLWQQIAELGFVYPDDLSVAGIRIVLNQFRFLDNKLSTKVEAAILCSGLFVFNIEDAHGFFPLRGVGHVTRKHVRHDGVNIIVDELEGCGMVRTQIRNMFLRRIRWNGYPRRDDHNDDWSRLQLAKARCFYEHDSELHSAIEPYLHGLWELLVTKKEPSSRFIQNGLEPVKDYLSAGLYRLSTPTRPGHEPFFRKKVIELLALGRIDHAYVVLDVLGNVVGARTRASWRGENRRAAILETLEKLFLEAFYKAFHVNQDFMAAADLVTEFSWSTQVEKLGKDELRIVHQAAAVLGHKLQPKLEIFAPLFTSASPQKSE